MIVQCPQCSTRFRLDPRRLGDRGAKVTCSVCNHSFVVPAKDLLDPFAAASDPFATSNIDKTAADHGPGSFDYSAHDAKTAVHQVPTSFRVQQPEGLDLSITTLDLPGRDESFDAVAVHRQPHEMPPRDDTRPDQRSTSLLGEEFLPRYPDDETTVSDDVSVIEDAEIATIDEGEFEAVDEGEASAPQHMLAELSRVPTTIARIPSLSYERRGEESKIHRLPLDNTAQSAVSLERPVNEAHAQLQQNTEIGAPTLVGKIDPSLLRAARAQAEELDPLMMSGGLSADGTYTPPQELTRPAIVGYNGFESEQQNTENRRATRPMEAVSIDEKAQRPTAPPLAVEVSAKTRFMRGAVTAAMLVGFVGLGLFALVRSGQLDIEALKDPEFIVHNNGVSSGSSGVDGVTPVALRSLVYPTSRGSSVLVFTGEVRNSGSVPVHNLDVVAELRDASGNLVATAREPLGAVLTVAELATLGDQGSIDRAFAAKRVSGSIAAGASVPYMVVIAPVPRPLRTGRHLVRLVQRSAEPPVVTAPVLPLQPSIANEAPQNDLMLRKAKMKAKRMKMKRRAAGGEGASEPVPE